MHIFNHQFKHTRDEKNIDFNGGSRHIALSSGTVIHILQR